MSQLGILLSMQVNTGTDIIYKNVLLNVYSNKKKTRNTEKFIKFTMKRKQSESPRALSKIYIEKEDWGKNEATLFHSSQTRTGDTLCINHEVRTTRIKTNKKIDIVNTVRRLPLHLMRYGLFVKKKTKKLQENQGIRFTSNSFMRKYPLESTSSIFK